MLVVLTGPTASGKTDVALKLADELPIEVISADSRQVYRGMDIGTAKPSRHERERVPHHVIDVANPRETFNAHRFVQEAKRSFVDITRRNRIPLVVGGAGFYIKALLNEQLLADVPPDPELRRDLANLQEHEGLEALAARLERLDPARAASVDQANPRRLVRAIEVAEGRGLVSDPHSGSIAAVVLGIDQPRETLAERIERRASAMYANGLIDEALALLQHGVPADSPALTGVGYSDAAAFIDGRLTLDEARERTIVRTRQFARRQRTWFRHQLPVHWIAPEEIAQVTATHLRSAPQPEEF